MGIAKFKSIKADPNALYNYGVINYAYLTPNLIYSDILDDRLELFVSSLEEITNQNPFDTLNFYEILNNLIQSKPNLIDLLVAYNDTQKRRWQEMGLSTLENSNLNFLKLIVNEDNLNAFSDFIKPENKWLNLPEDNGDKQSFVDKFNNSTFGKHFKGWSYGADLTNNILTGFVSDKMFGGPKGNITLTIDNAWNTASNIAANFGPVGLMASLGMKGLNVLNKGVNLALGSKALSNMTTVDAALNNPLTGWNVGLVNALGGTTVDTITKDSKVQEVIGSSYTGSYNKIDDALEKSGARYGLFSLGAANKANQEIMEAKNLLKLMTNIANQSLDAFNIRNSMSAINGNRRNYAMLGGYNQSSVQIGKKGMILHTKLQKAKNILAKTVNPTYILLNEEPFNYLLNEEPFDIILKEDKWKLKEGGTIGSIINLIKPIFKTEEPVVQEFKEGGYDQSGVRVGMVFENNLQRAKNILKAQKGTLFYDNFLSNSLDPDAEFQAYIKSLPKNLQYAEDFRVRDYWEFNGRPKDFLEAVLKGMFTFVLDDGGWHAHSVAENPKTGEIEFMKSSSHPSIQKELDWYNSDEAKDFRKEYELVKSEPYWKYVKRKTPLKEDESLEKKSRTIEELIEYAKLKNPRFIQRMSEPIKYVDLGNGMIGTHKLSWATTDKPNEAIVYPEIFETENGELIYDPEHAFDNARKGDALYMTPEEAELFTTQYKQGWTEFFNKFQKGGSFNVIPEGALHARKHNMENADNLTKKGIPVVSETKDGLLEQQAEIERNEVILRLEVTKKLEELLEKYYSDDYTQKQKDEFAIEAGKLLTYELLQNTLDNTGLLNEV